MKPLYPLDSAKNRAFCFQPTINHVKSTLLTIGFVTLLSGCGGGGGGGNGGGGPGSTPNSLDIDALNYVRHSFVENTVKVPLPQWEPLQSIEFPDEFAPLELEIEPIGIATGQWRSFFVVLAAESADHAFSNELRNKTVLSSRQIIINGFPADQTVYEGIIIFTNEDGDGESLATPNQGGNVRDLFRFLQTTVNVNGEFYTLLYVAEVTDYVRYEEIAYHLADSMEFATRLPIRRKDAASDLVSASTDTNTVFAYCELDNSFAPPQMSLNTLRLTSGRVEFPEVTITSFPHGINECSAIALAYGDEEYLLMYASRTGQNEVLVAQILDAQGQASDEGIVLATAAIAPSEHVFDDLNITYDGNRYFAAWTELQLNGGSGSERRQLVGQFIDENHIPLERIVFEEDLVPRYETHHRRLALAQTEQSIGLATSFSLASAPSEQTTRLHLIDRAGNPLPSSPVAVHNHNNLELLDLDLVAIGSTYTAFWVERNHTPNNNTLFDDRLVARQLTSAGQLLNEFPTLVMGPLLNIQGLEYERDKLEVKSINDEFYFIWESNLADDGNRYTSRAYGMTAGASLDSRSEPEVMQYVSSGLHNLTLILHEERSYLTWLPEISSNHAPVWTYFRDSLLESPRVATESLIP